MGRPGIWGFARTARITMFAASGIRRPIWENSVNSLVSSIATVWHLAAPYFRSEDRWRGRILLASLVAIELAVVGITVLVTQWNNAFYNALQDRNWNVFVYQLAYFSVLAAANMVLRVYQLYLNQWLQIRWRRWMTEHYLERWLRDANHYRMQLLGDGADNPDQRIAEDIRLFVERTLRIGLAFLNSVVTFFSFLVMLWGLSQDAPLPLFGMQATIPGYLVWAALIYSVVGTGFAHLIGRKLIGLLFEQQRYEADFRFNLVRVRENSEQIALLGGESAESHRLMRRFGSVVTNWNAIMSRQKKLTFFTAGFDQASVVFPFILISPAYFAGIIQLGAVMQTASAFGSVQTALSFFVLTYADLADWRSTVNRLVGFDRTIDAARATAAAAPGIEVEPYDKTALSIRDLTVELPTGAPLVTTQDIVIEPGERTLLSGPSGAGKSTLFRAVAGIWRYGSGTIRVPRGAKLMILPQRPYFPVASLEGAVNYPAERGDFTAEETAAVLVAVGLPALAAHLSEEAHWNSRLSLGEQQRLAIARAILHAPDYLFLDEATASLDEPSEAALYRLLHERLPGATIVSIGHRSTLAALHRRRLIMTREDDRHRVSEAALQPAAE